MQVFAQNSGILDRGSAEDEVYGVPVLILKSLEILRK